LSRPSISIKLQWKVIRDPIYNYILYNKDVEGAVIDTIYVQRLRRIRQLQVAYMVYPGADHTRFQHSLGVMHLSGLFAESLLSYIEAYADKEILEGYDKSLLIEAVRIAGLLHDLGHGPYSHAFEEAVLMKSPELKNKNLDDHEKVGISLIKNTNLSELIEKVGKNVGYDDLLDIVVELLSEYKPTAPTILKLLQKTIKNWIYPADIMDFLVRDSYYTGTKEYGTVDYYRLILYSYPYDDSIVLDEKAIFTLRSFLQSRYYMFETVYLHPVCRSFDKLVQKIISLVSEHLELPQRIIEIKEGKPERFLELDDFSILHMVNSLKDSDEKVKKAKGYLNDLLMRRSRWKPIGPGYNIVLPARSATFFLKYSRIEGAAHDLEKVLREILSDKGLSHIADEIWVDHNLKRTLPAVPYPLQTIKVGKKTAEGINATGELSLTELLEESGLSPRVTFVIFAPTNLVKDRSMLRKIREAADQAYSYTFSSLRGITM